MVSNDPAVATKVRVICISCVGASIVELQELSTHCTGCVGLLDVFQRLLAGIRDSTRHNHAVVAIHVPPNQVPHLADCEYRA